MRQILIPARSAVTVAIKSGQKCRIVNTEGGQVVDTWAFNPDDHDEYLSMEHSRSAIYKLLFEVGDGLVSNHFRPMLSITADTSPGYHDTLHAACSAGSNQFYGAKQIEPNCQNNLIQQLAILGHQTSHVPCPWNLFEHALVKNGSTLVDETSTAAPGDFIELEAMMDLLIICSACPSQVGQISGHQPRGAALEII
jgi:uncharacterized protein YcgI (DUF1989 family)